MEDAVVCYRTKGMIDVKPHFFDDPEPLVTFKEPSVRDWLQNVRNAQHVGFLLAGTVEFYWIVYLKIISTTDAEYHSVGNLISFNYVITSCRALLQDGPFRESYPLDSIEVIFGSQFIDNQTPRAPWNNWEAAQDTTDTVSGERAVIHLAHPNCDTDRLSLHDIGLLTLDQGIPSFPPQIGYAPTVNLPPESTSGSKFVEILRTKVLCYVASYGKAYSNQQTHYAVNRKVKFRVYLETMDWCARELMKICHANGDSGCYEMHQNRTAMDEFYLCFRSRAKVGTVCDHDRGAPLVCDDQVYGIVSRGALKDFCSNVYPLPFLVFKIDNLNKALSAMEAEGYSSEIKPLRYRMPTFYYSIE